MLCYAIYSGHDAIQPAAVPVLACHGISPRSKECVRACTEHMPAHAHAHAHAIHWSGVEWSVRCGYCTVRKVWHARRAVPRTVRAPANTTQRNATQPSLPCVALHRLSFPSWDESKRIASHNDSIGFDWIGFDSSLVVRPAFEVVPVSSLFTSWSCCHCCCCHHHHSCSKNWFRNRNRVPRR